MLAILNSTTVSNSDINKKCILSTKSVLKDHVILNTGVMAAENSALPAQNEIKF